MARKTLDYEDRCSCRMGYKLLLACTDEILGFAPERANRSRRRPACARISDYGITAAHPRKRLQRFREHLEDKCWEVVDSLDVTCAEKGGKVPR